MGMFDLYHEWKHHLKIYLMNEYGGTYRIHKVIWKIQSMASFDFQKATYIINLKNAVMTSRNNPILFYKLGNPQPMELIEINQNNIKNPIKGSAKELRSLLLDDSTGEILNEGKTDKMLMVVGVAGLMVLIIVGVAIYIISQQNKELSEMALKLAQIYANATKTNGVIVIP